MRILSLGAGVQSTTLSLMLAHGEFDDTVSAGLFADTGWEPAHTYRHLWNLAALLPFPILVVSAGNLRDDVLAKASRGEYLDVPYYQHGGQMGRRQCTWQYKLRPIQRKVRELIGAPVKGACEMWVGISLDEATRMKPSSVGYIENRWPLIEKRMTRAGCLRWLAEHDYPTPPKSSCLGCPYKSDSQWLALRMQSPREWAETVEIDRLIRGGRNGEAQFTHRSCVALDEADIDPYRDQVDMFQNECEGMCGV